MTDAPVVRVLGLGRRFGELVAARELSFEVRDGELFGIVGPDGAGKTTTLRMLAGVLRPTEGDAIVAGVSVRADPEGAKASTAYMSQRFGLYADLTVRENVQFYADLYGVPRAARAERLDRLYAFSGLAPFEDRLAGQLSGGMKQKLSLSCALIHRPWLLLLDEPTFGVDPISRRDLWLILHEMVAGGTTVIVSTAYLDEAERCDRVALLHAGRLLALDEPRRLQEAFPGELLAVRVARPREAADVLRAVPAVRRTAPFGDLLHVAVADADRDWPEAEAALRAAGVTDVAVERIQPSLEDVYIERVTAEGGPGTEGSAPAPAEGGVAAGEGIADA